MSKVENEVRIDLHVHSSYSDKPFSWFLRSANAAECYTAPDKVYETATRRGMNLITLTDHDTIDGALELRARYDNTFLSEEVSARFPEDGCIVHTIALDITEEQHRELQRLRRNIYELVSYMDQEDIPYFWCHPFSDVNRRLTPSHVERCFLMFRVLELRNGTRDKVHEDRLVSMLEELTPDQLCRWAERYPQTPTINLDAKYALTGGSDDHGGIAIARAYTTFSGEASAAGLRLALRESATTPNGEAGKGTTLAHNCYGVTAGYFASRGQFGTGDDKSKVSLPLLTLLGDRKRRIEQGGGAISRDELSSHGHTSAYQDELYNHVEPALVGGWRSAFEGLLGALGHGRVTEAADGVSDLIKSLLFELPYILAHRWHVRDREVANRLYKSFDFNRPLAKSVRVAILTDTIDDVDGVAIGLRRLHAEARRWGLHLDLVGSSDCERAHYDQDGVFRVPSVFEHRIAEYSQYAWKVPHLPALLRYISDQRIDLIQCSTPGPVGIVGMIAGRLTGVPVIGQFHTDLPEYTLRLTGDPTVAGMMRGFVSWFYRCMDHTLVPSDWVGDMMRDFGVAEERISRIPRGIDLDLFRPDRRDQHAFAEYGVNGEPKILYVGRISKEKGLQHLAEGFSRLSSAMPAARLIMIGDGPFADEFATMVPRDKVVFTGTLKGEKLARMYASGDVFVFPSETETFGNVVVEAQASGLPVVVSDRGAAHENMRDGVTGMVVDHRDAHKLSWTLQRLLEDSELRRRMSGEAHEFSQRYSMTDALRGTFREYTKILYGNNAPEQEAPAAPPTLREVRDHQ